MVNVVSEMIYDLLVISYIEVGVESKMMKDIEIARDELICGFVIVDVNIDLEGTHKMGRQFFGIMGNTGRYGSERGKICNSRFVHGSLPQLYNLIFEIPMSEIDNNHQDSKIHHKQ